MAAFGPDDVDRLLLDPGIVRNRAKIESAIDNARAVLALEAGGTPFVDYLWSFVGGHAIQNRVRGDGDSCPAETAESAALSKDLKKRGFRFVGHHDCTRSCRRWAWSTTTLVDLLPPRRGRGSLA